MGTTELEALVVKIAVDMQDVKKGMKRASDETKKGAKSISGELNKVVRGYIKWAVAIRAGLFAYRQFVTTVNRVDALQNLSENLGTTAKQMAGLQLAANLVGVANEQLTIGLRSLQRNLGLAALGTGEAASALKILNLDATEVSKLPLAEAFAKIGDAISKYGDKTKQAAIASRIFGESGGQLLKLFKGGSALLEGAAEDAEKFGTAISELDARKIQAVKDETTRLSEAWTGFATAMTVKASPMIRIALSKISAAIAALTPETTAARKAMIRMANSAQMLGDALTKDVDRSANGFLDLIARIDAAGKKQMDMSLLIREATGDRLTSEEAAIEASFRRRLDAIRALEKANVFTVAEASQQMADARIDMEAELAESMEALRQADFQKKIELLDAEADASLAALDRMTRARDEESQKELARIENERAARVTALSSASSLLGSLADLNEATSKKQFESTKNLRRGEVGLNTASAVMAIWGDSSLPTLAKPLQIAAALAAGATQLANINSSTFGGGGGAGGGGGGAPAPVLQQNVSDVTIRVGQGADIRELLLQLDDARADNVIRNLNVTTEN